MDARSHFQRGIRDLIPILPGVVPFGTITGIAAIEAGLGVAHEVGLSTLVFAGAAQLAAISLLGQNAALVVVVVTALVINARFLMYSASLSAHFAGLPFSQRATAAYLLTDQAYAFSISRYRAGAYAPAEKMSYYLGAGTTLWVVWQISTLAGALLGAQVPEAWSLDFAIPLVFLALLVPAIRDRADGVAAGVAGALAVAVAGLPYNLALPVAAIAGIGAAVAFERKVGR